MQREKAIMKNVQMSQKYEYKNDMAVEFFKNDSKTYFNRMDFTARHESLDGYTVNFSLRLQHKGNGNDEYSNTAYIANKKKDMGSTIELNYLQTGPNFGYGISYKILFYDRFVYNLTNPSQFSPENVKNSPIQCLVFLKGSLEAENDTKLLHFFQRHALFKMEPQEIPHNEIEKIKGDLQKIIIRVKRQIEA